MLSKETIAEFLKSQRDMKINVEHSAKLATEQKVNSWSLSIILASSADGAWNFSREEYSYGVTAAQHLKKYTLPKIAPTSHADIKIIHKATKQDLLSCLHDTQVENIVLVWHGSYDSRVWKWGSVHIQDIVETQPSHLKKWVFINTSCANYNIRNFLYPLWFFSTVDQKKVLWNRPGRLGSAYTFAEKRFRQSMWRIQHDIGENDIQYVDKHWYSVDIAKSIIAMDIIMHSFERVKWLPKIQPTLSDKITQAYFKIVNAPIKQPI